MQLTKRYVDRFIIGEGSERSNMAYILKEGYFLKIIFL